MQKQKFVLIELRIERNTRVEEKADYKNSRAGQLLWQI